MKDRLAELEKRLQRITELPRSMGASAGTKGTASTDASRIAPPDLSSAVLQAFEELHRQRHSSESMVPIHEIRAWIAEHIGPSYAGHDVLDDVIKRTGARDAGISSRSAIVAGLRRSN